LNKRTHLRLLSMFMAILLSLVGVFALTEASRAQERRTFKPGEKVETGGGMFAEILSCRGAGENEECEIQYYRGDDKESTPRWENTFFLRTAEERVLEYKRRQTEAQPANVVAPNPPAHTDDVNKPAIKDETTATCAFGAPPGDASKNAKASEGLFKRKIYDRYNVYANGSTTAPLRVGITFVSFQVSKPFINVVRVDRVVGAYRVNDAAPVNATIYPVISKHVVCEEYRDRTLRKQVENKYACFKNKDGEWVCGADGIPKTTQIN